MLRLLIVLVFALLAPACLSAGDDDATTQQAAAAANCPPVESLPPVLEVVDDCACQRAGYGHHATGPNPAGFCAPAWPDRTTDYCCYDAPTNPATSCSAFDVSAEPGYQKRGITCDGTALACNGFPGRAGCKYLGPSYTEEPAVWCCR